jgi:hypothetical protein
VTWVNKKHFNISKWVMATHFCESKLCVFNPTSNLDLIYMWDPNQQFICNNHKMCVCVCVCVISIHFKIQQKFVIRCFTLINFWSIKQTINYFQKKFKQQYKCTKLIETQLGLKKILSIELLFPQYFISIFVLGVGGNPRGW